MLNKESIERLPQTIEELECLLWAAHEGLGAKGSWPTESLVADLVAQIRSILK